MMGKTHMGFGYMFSAVAIPAANHVLGLGIGMPEQMAGVALGGTIGGLLPDIDHPKSLLSNGVLPQTKVLGVLGSVLGFLFCLPPVLIGKVVRGTGINHRGPTHSFLFGAAWTFLFLPLYVLMAAVIAVIGTTLVSAAGVGHAIGFLFVLHWLWGHAATYLPLVMVAIGAGYLSHLFADGLTNVPIPLFWPFKPFAQHEGMFISRGRFFLLPKGLRITTSSPFETVIIRPIVYLVAALCVIALIGYPGLTHKSPATIGTSINKVIHPQAAATRPHAKAAAKK
jgi:membrane-bound metal-dependent hydrolase YbcI (DUF457 family)